MSNIGAVTLCCGVLLKVPPPQKKKVIAAALKQKLQIQLEYYCCKARCRGASCNIRMIKHHNKNKTKNSPFSHTTLAYITLEPAFPVQNGSQKGLNHSQVISLMSARLLQE